MQAGQLSRFALQAKFRFDYLRFSGYDFTSELDEISRIAEPLKTLLGKVAGNCAIVFVVDATNVELLPSAKAMLHDVLRILVKLKGENGSVSPCLMILGDKGDKGLGLSSSQLMRALGVNQESVRKLKREVEELMWVASTDTACALSRVPVVGIKRILTYLGEYRKEIENVVPVSDAFMYATSPASPSSSNLKFSGRPFAGVAHDVTELAKAMDWLALHLSPLGMVEKAVLLAQRFFCIEGPAWVLERRGQARPVLQFLDRRGAGLQ
jgi:hypothetical protein